MRVCLHLDATLYAGLFHEIERMSKRTRAERVRHLAAVGLMLEQGRLQDGGRDARSASDPGDAGRRASGAAAPIGLLAKDLTESGVGMD